MKTITLIFIILFLYTSSDAQEMWGISNSNYSGSYGIALNPSTIVGAPYKYDANILGLDIFLENNMAYIPASDKIFYRTFHESSDGPTVVVDDFSSSKKSLFVHAQVFGPSYFWAAEKNYAWGFHTAFRTEAGVLKVPFAFNNFGVQNNSGSQESYSVPAFSLAMMSWAEAGVTYGKVARNETRKYVKWGVTLNYILPIAGAYLDVKNLDYSTSDSTLFVNNVEATIGHAMPGEGQNPISKRGWGLGTTMGITIMHGRSERAYSLKRAADGLQKYKTRLGISLMDLGFARFNSPGAGVVNLSSTGATSANNLHNFQFGSFQHFDTASVNQIGGSYNNKPFNIWLPTALSLQFDYALSEHWYFNTTVLNRVHFMPNQVARGNQDVMSLRYERRNFEMAFNLNLFEYSNFSSGFAFRYKWFIIGTDRFSQYASITDFNSIDIYFGFKINFIDVPKKTRHSTSCPAYKSHS